MRAWVAAHPGYFAFWTGFLVVLLALWFAGLWFIRRQVTRVVGAIHELAAELRRPR